MWKALAFKELRDVLPIACIAVLAYMACVANWIGYPIFLSSSLYDIGIPFLNGNHIPAFFLISLSCATGLGFWQTVAESKRGTWLFLLHRPIPRITLIAIKLAVGAACYLVVSAVAILAYAAWAAAPGAHASPFAWWMTNSTWNIWLLVMPCYLGAFLSGIRPGRWFGSRLIPLIAVMAACQLIFLIFSISSATAISAVLLLSALLVSQIMFLAQSRDFS